MKEVWKDIPGYEGRYQASTYGRIRRFYFHGKPRHELVAPSKKQSGHLVVGLNNGSNIKVFGVHVIIAATFISRPKLEVNHKNYDPSDNHIENLEWVTHAENQRHSGANPARKRKLIKNQSRTDRLEDRIAKTIAMVNNSNPIKPGEEQVLNHLTKIK